MTIQDINETIQAFASDAKFCEEIGFDGVEIHGAHGYLIDNFFWNFFWNFFNNFFDNFFDNFL